VLASVRKVQHLDVGDRAKTRIRLDNEKYGKTMSVSIVPCHILGRTGFYPSHRERRQRQGSHPLTIVEIACEFNLCKRYDLKDGDD
jgi:hypothetical protein